jgi:hypothetical protein
VLIDYYPHKSTGGSPYALVTFQQHPPRAMFAGPRWKDMADEHWRALGLRPHRTTRTS